ncbi:MAG: tRNA (cytidine32/uridine32-2'-O)-methyltransferase [Gammaproteobacteria bacterium]|jgi:tRNA (cytidine32/uridine32-2'-O)-methyltransferase
MRLSNVVIVMIGTTHPGNIGAAARAMHNMGLERLVLVDPACDVNEEAYARASGANSILDNRVKVNSIQEAVKTCQLVLGASVRQRTLSWPEISSVDLGSKLAEYDSETEVAILFGREHCGLSNEELALCHYRLYIPANPDFSSLNVASAIQLICYELYRHYGIEQSDQVDQPAKNEPRANHAEVEGMINHWQSAIIKSGYLDLENPGLLMSRLRRLFQRCHLSINEVNILRGILNSIERYSNK